MRETDRGDHVCEFPSLKFTVPTGEPVVPAKAEVAGARRWRLVVDAKEKALIDGALVRAENAYERDDEAKALEIMKELAERYPNNVQVLDEVALLFRSYDEPGAARFFWKRAIETGMAGLPDDLLDRGWTLPYSFESNRNLLHSLNALAFLLMEEGDLPEALDLLEVLLGLDPEDAFVARAKILYCHFALQQPDSALTICEVHPEDPLVEIVFGRILALHQSGRKEEARARAAEAAKTHPLVVKELFRPSRHPRHSGDTQDHAWHYWHEFKRFWIASAGAIGMMKEAQRTAKQAAKHA
jgi:tetratricopeptide (TPR) repeat protein